MILRTNHQALPFVIFPPKKNKNHNYVTWIYLLLLKNPWNRTNKLIEQNERSNVASTFYFIFFLFLPRKRINAISVVIHANIAVQRTLRTWRLIKHWFFTAEDRRPLPFKISLLWTRSVHSRFLALYRSRWQKLFA